MEKKTLILLNVFKKILYKLFNNQKYKELKYLKEDKKKFIFKNIYEKKIIL